MELWKLCLEEKRFIVNPLPSFKSALCIASLFARKFWIEKALQRTAGEVVPSVQESRFSPLIA